MSHIPYLGLQVLQLFTASGEDAIWRFRFAPAKAKSIDGYVRISEKDQRSRAATQRQE